MVLATHARLCLLCLLWPPRRGCLPPPLPQPCGPQLRDRRAGPCARLRELRARAAPHAYPARAAGEPRTWQRLYLQAAVHTLCMCSACAVHVQRMCRACALHMCTAYAHPLQAQLLGFASADNAQPDASPKALLAATLRAARREGAHVRRRPPEATGAPSQPSPPQPAPSKPPPPQAAPAAPAAPSAQVFNALALAEHTPLLLGALGFRAGDGLTSIHLLMGDAAGPASLPPSGVAWLPLQ
eukprot:scaffold79366_cov60-Phaeocystis_antarctica.AAC.3